LGLGRTPPPATAPGRPAAWQIRSYLSALRASVWPVRRLYTGRLGEVDAWRGVAICMMVVYHLLWDLSDLAGYDIAVRSGFWRYFQIATAGLFTILVGVSLSLSYQRQRPTSPPGSLWPSYLLRGVVLFTWGLAISLVTLLIYGPDRYVRFGILHLIGLSIVLAYPLLRFRWLNLALGLVISALGPVMRAIRPEFVWLEWLAPTPGGGIDYAPLIPMFGPVLIGVFLGNSLYPGGSPRFPVPPWLLESPPVRFLRHMGQNSLFIYLVHQPLLIALLLLSGVAEW
jgi:uncharacterized membrane protein